MKKHKIFSIVILIVLISLSVISFSGCKLIGRYLSDGVSFIVETDDMCFVCSRKSSTIKTATIHRVKGEETEDGFVVCNIPSQVEHEGIIYTVTAIKPSYAYEFLGHDEQKLTEGKIKQINLPETVENINFDYEGGFPYLESIYVDEKNANFKSVDGVLYSKDGAKLVYYPTGRTDTTFTIPQNMTCCDNPTMYHNLDMFSFGRFDDIYVEDGNMAYKSIDGVLYSFDGTKLLHYSRTKTNTAFFVPKEVVTVSGLYNVNLKNIAVANGNVAFKSINGILYSFDVTSIICYPINNETEHYLIPQSIKCLDKYDLSDKIKNLKTIYIPSDIVEINYLTIPDDVKIYIERDQLPSGWNFFESNKLNILYGVSLEEYKNIISTWEDTDK